MKTPHHHERADFSIMPLPIFVVLGVVVGWVIYRYSENLLLSVGGGIVSVPISVWILDLVFNNPLALRFQNYAGNHSCPTCHRRYESFVSMPSSNNTVILKCLRCGSSHRFDKKYHHIEATEFTKSTKAEQDGGGDSAP